MTERVTGLIFDNAAIGDSLDKLIASVHKKHKVKEICKIEIRSANVYPNPIDAKYEVLIEFESKVDWSKVQIDTKVEYVISEGRMIKFGYFAGIRSGLPAVWDDGSTEWSSDGCFTIPYEIKLANAT